MRQDEQRSLLHLHGAKQPRPGRQRRDQHQDGADQRASERPELQREQCGHQRGSGEAADAEQRVEAGHQRTSRGALHLNRVDVHGDVDGAERGAEREQCQRQRHAGVVAIVSRGRTRARPIPPAMMIGLLP